MLPTMKHASFSTNVFRMSEVKGYWLVKRPCDLCETMGVIMVPEGMTLEEIRDSGIAPAFDPDIAEDEATCPECEGCGWYYEEREN